jgi:hypothetical protein
MIRGNDLSVFADRAENHEMSTGPLRADFCHFRRTEAARESELGFIVHHLVAKDENRVFLKSGSHGGIRGRIGCDLCNSHSA